MTQLNGINNLPIVPGTSQGPGDAGPSVSRPQGPPLSNPTGLTARSAAGSNLQRPRNSALPPPGGHPAVARPASGGPQASRLPRPVSQRAQTVSPTATRPAAQPTSTASPNQQSRPTATATASTPNVQSPEQASTTTQNVAPSAAEQQPPVVTPQAQVVVSDPPPMPTIVVTPPGDPSSAGGKSGPSYELAAKTSAANEDSTQEAAKHMHESMKQMQAVMELNMKHQLEMSLMKMIADMSNALAKELKKTGEAVKNLAG